MKNILITGATSGIGRNAAEVLAKEDYRLFLVGRNVNKLEELKKIVGSNSTCIECNLENPQNVSHIFDVINAEDVKLDGLVYCAGISTNQGVRGIDLDIYDKIISVNYESYLAMCSYFIKKDFSNEGASIVCISSLSAKTCFRGTAAYSVSKASILTINKVLSKEVIKRKIRVNSILPGYVRTPMMDGTTEEDIVVEQPWGYIEPDEITDIIKFLLSDSGRMITGSEIVISGGMNF